LGGGSFLETTERRKVRKWERAVRMLDALEKGAYEVGENNHKPRNSIGGN